MAAFRPARVLRALVPLLALAACDGASTPSGVEGRYGVYSVNGHRPPAAVAGTFSGGVVQVVDADLRLDAPDATVELETRLVAANGTASAATSTTYSGSYQASGDRITFTLLDSSEQGAPRVRAEGVVVSPKEVVVTLHFAASTSQGYFTYPVSLILRR